ncbi:berberine bridge enzyme-like 17 [Populus alba x Populus x berolinensis]|uniref:Berberine bridge enzyme-like 17 n=1 Tax=Populus alba x Populus x berolinensis TaxID=444605 RepID=A0AAD6Q609_9ROSI|nr:berberine bridge enzyme-like 17 [Populus alba x Populus x berolinensis]
MTVILSVFSALLLSVSLAANSDPSLDKFLQCLPDNSLPSYPISEAIYTTANPSFESVLLTYINNRRFLTPKTPKPLAIVTALHESHVQATVVCAKSHGLQVRIRSGGHDYEGLSYVSEVPFVILDMFNLRSIDIDLASETAWVQAGATLGEIYYNIANRSNVHAFPAGVCPTVGAGGHISGGGYGTLMRKYGLSVDNVIDAKVVDDLFWAIRGGGGASFGVILSWKINLVRVPAKVTVFKVDRTLEEGATDIFYQWQQVSTELDKELGLFLGQSGALISMMNKRFPKLGLQQSDCIEMRWIESTLFWFDLPNGTSIDVLLNRPRGAQSFYKNKSDYVNHIVPKEALERIWKMMIKAEPMWMQWNPIGGRMSEIPDTATPFPHRAGYLFKLQYSINWSEEGTEATDRYISLIREMHDAMAPYVTKFPREAFQNYRDLDIGSSPSNRTNFEEAKEYGLKYFKGNFLRLVKVKGMVDPDNFFKHEQSIPPRWA